jgi:hypothetical protein
MAFHVSAFHVSNFSANHANQLSHYLHINDVLFRSSLQQISNLPLATHVVNIPFFLVRM